MEGKAEDVLGDIRRTLQPDELDYVPQVALIAIVGEGMSHAIGIAAKVFGALAGQFVLSQYWPQLMRMLLAEPRPEDALRGRAI